jgi:hypothetical protein
MSKYESYRVNNFDKRWNTADLLYFGWRPKTVWDGTNIPRSSLGIPFVFDQVETAFPKIIQAFFYDPVWFEVVPESAADAQAARDVRDALLFYLEQDSGSYGISARSDIELAIQSVLLYGNGVLALEWDEIRRRPTVSWVDLRDMYIDPGCPVPWIDGCRSVVRRRLMTVDELAELRNDPRMNIPPNEILYTLSVSTPWTVGDTTKNIQEALRGVTSYTHDTSSPNPAENKVEVLVYYSRSRIIWVLGRTHVAFIGTNPYGFIPFVSAACYNVLGRWYGLSIADVQESNQRVIEGLINGRLDEINLALHPPRAQRRGVITTPSQQRWRPGAVFQVSDPKDIALLSPQMALTNVFQDVQYIESLAERRTGTNSATMGVMRPSNANRTAGGIQAQMQAAGSRLHKIVSNITDHMLVPMLYKLYRIVQYHTIVTDVLPALAAPGSENPTNDIRYISAEAFRKPMKFRIEAADRLASRDRLAQMFPMVSQFVFNGPFLEQLASIGKTFDPSEFLKLFQDVAGTSRRYELFRDMTPEEQQAYQASRAQAAQQQQMSEKLQIAQIERDTRLQMGRMKAEAELEKAKIMAGASREDENPEKLRLEHESRLQEHHMKLAETRAKQELEAMKAQLAAVTRQQELILEYLKSKLAAEARQAAQTGPEPGPTGPQEPGNTPEL